MSYRETDRERLLVEALREAQAEIAALKAKREEPAMDFDDFLARVFQACAVTLMLAGSAAIVAAVLGAAVAAPYVAGVAGLATLWGAAAGILWLIRNT